MIAFTTPPETLVWTTDFRNFRNALPIRYRDAQGTLYQAPGGSWTDLASTPPALWIKYPPFGLYAIPADLHDNAYRDTLERVNPGAPEEVMQRAQAMRQDAIALLKQADELEQFCWVKASLDKEASDTLFDDAMLAKGVDTETRKVLYEGVNIFGWKAFRDDRKVAP